MPPLSGWTCHALVPTSSAELAAVHEARKTLQQRLVFVDLPLQAVCDGRQALFAGRGIITCPGQLSHRRGGGGTRDNGLQATSRGRKTELSLPLRQGFHL